MTVVTKQLNSSLAALFNSLEYVMLVSLQVELNESLKFKLT